MMTADDIFCLYYVPSTAINMLHSLSTDQKAHFLIIHKLQIGPRKVKLLIQDHLVIIGQTSDSRACNLVLLYLSAIPYHCSGPPLTSVFLELF